MSGDAELGMIRNANQSGSPAKNFKVDKYWAKSNDVNDALHQLASRTTTLEGGTTPDAADVTYTPADNTKWDSSADPGDVDQALDQLASRAKALETVAGWSLVLNQSGASATGWTSGGGAWSSDGTVIKQTDTAGTFRTAYFATAQPVSPAYILEADVKMVSAGAQTVRTVGLVVGYSGAANNPGVGVDMRLQTTRKILLMRAFTTELSTIAFTFSDDTFYKLRVVTSGGIVNVYIDGTLIGGCGQFINNSTDIRFVGLQSYGCEAHFKNIKGWGMALP